jgi:nitrogen fixation NifU-like protein
MDDDLYGEELLDLAECPDFHGRLDAPHYAVDLDNPLCGDEIHFELEVDPESQIIRKVRFDCDGCIMSQAGSTCLAQLIEGKTLAEARNLSDQIMMKQLQIQISPTRIKCWLLGWRAMQHAIPAEIVATRPGLARG